MATGKAAASAASNVVPAAGVPPPNGSADGKWEVADHALTSVTDIFKAYPLQSLFLIGFLVALAIGLYFLVQYKLGVKKLQHPGVDPEVVKKLIEAFDSAIKAQATTNQALQKTPRQPRKPK